jgi:hypothetical protein
MSDRYARAPRSAGPLGLMPTLGLQSSAGLLTGVGLLPSLGQTTGDTLLAFRVTDGLTDWTFARTGDATYVRIA